MTERHGSVDSVDKRLLEGFSTSFLNESSVYSDPAYRAKFLSNEPRRNIHVYVALQDELRRSSEFFFSVAFFTEAGLSFLKGDLQDFVCRGGRGRILVSDFNYFNKPKDLRRLLEMVESLNAFAREKNQEGGASPAIEAKLFRCSSEEGFHTKGYVFKAGGLYRMIVGSSNLTSPALTENREWNVRLVGKREGEVTERLVSEFEALWSSPRSFDLKAGLPRYEKDWEEKRPIYVPRPKLSPAPEMAAIEPNGMQRHVVDSVYELYSEGKKRALLISATGTGKTYASAFTVRKIAPRRVLFLVHREQIALQAMASFKRVLGGGFGDFGLYSGHRHDSGAKYTFATMQTMSKDENLAAFGPEAFDFIIIDEVHRAGAASYQKIMSFFKPRFWFGMTASPDRPDGFDIYKLFDNNIAYEIHLQTALENDLLCPFHYYGITDLEVDGEKIEDERSFNLLTSDARVEHVLREARYFRFSGERVKGLAFCSTNRECEELARKFTKRGVPSEALSGEDSQEERAAMVERLEHGEGPARLDYIFTVDIFNEGVDIPEVNQVLLLRPTESPIIFIQQLGRGLRKAKGKDYVVVLDFIGRYKTNYLIPIALSGDRSYNKDNLRRFVAETRKYLPGASTIHFDRIVERRIFSSIDSAQTNSIQILKESYRTLKFKLGRIPRLVDFELHNAVDVQKFFENKSLGSYYAFLKVYDSDYKVRLSPEAEQMLTFWCSKLGNSKRVSEALVLEDLLQGRDRVLARLRESLWKNYGINASDQHLKNVVLVLTNQFCKNSLDQERTSKCVFLEPEGGDYRISGQFQATLLASPEFKAMLLELAQYMKRRYNSEYIKRYQETDFALYSKYTYEDVCRLLNWSRNMTAQNIGGYFYDKETKTLPVFVNYEKSEEAIAYEDRFESERILIALSKTKRRVDSPDADHMFKRTPEDRGNRIYLFVRKNKDDKEAKSFYFLGEMNAVGDPAPVRLQTGDAAFEIRYELEHPVREDIYDYLTNDFESRNEEN